MQSDMRNVVARVSRPSPVLEFVLRPERDQDAPFARGPTQGATDFLKSRRWTSKSGGVAGVHWCARVSSLVLLIRRSLVRAPVGEPEIQGVTWKA